MDYRNLIGLVSLQMDTLCNIYIYTLCISYFGGYIYSMVNLGHSSLILNSSLASALWHHPRTLVSRTPIPSHPRGGRSPRRKQQARQRQRVRRKKASPKPRRPRSKNMAKKPRLRQRQRQRLSRRSSLARKHQNPNPLMMNMKRLRNRKWRMMRR